MVVSPGFRQSCQIDVISSIQYSSKASTVCAVVKGLERRGTFACRSTRSDQCAYAGSMPWQHLRISRFGGPEVLEMVEEPALPEPGAGEVRIKVLAAGTGFTDTMIRRGRYPDFKGPLPFTPGYDIVGVVEKSGPGVVAPLEGEMVADLCVVGGYAQYAIRPARFLVPVPVGIDPAEAVCIPLAYLTAFQMLTRCRNLPSGATILVIGASGTVGTALLDLARHLGLKAIGTCSAQNLPVIERFGAAAIDYMAGDFVTSVRKLTSGGAGVDIAFDAIGGAHFGRSFACLVPGGLLVGYGSQTMAVGRESLVAAGLGLARLKVWSALSFLFSGRSAVFYSITARRSTHPEEFRGDMATLFQLLREGAIKPVVIERLPLAAASDIHARIDRGGLGGKIVLLPWSL
ncbi:MAG: medium chain dehydrogenase/reductase family protein [Steroidobacteraceae bacterium]